MTQAVKTKEDDDFLNDLLGEVDTNLPTPAPRPYKQQRSGERRKARTLSPAPEPASKKKKTVDDRLPSPPAPTCRDNYDGFVPPMDDDQDLPPMADVPTSDPAPSSPAAKVAERKAQVKQEQKDDEDEGMMEVSHAGAIDASRVNMSASRPARKLVKPDPYPSPGSSSPLKGPDSSVDSSSWNRLTEKLNVVSSSPGSADARVVGKIDHRDAIEADGSLNFFWTDYTEVNGSLCMFGKVLNKKTKNYVSCFIKIDNILRKLYFLPRKHRVRDGQETEEEVGMMDVYNEVDEMMTKMNVGIYKIKSCTRKYAFEIPGIPKEAEYMKLLYPYTSKLVKRLLYRPWCADSN